MRLNEITAPADLEDDHLDEAMSRDEFDAMLRASGERIAKRRALADELSQVEKPLRLSNASGLTALVGLDMSKPGRYRVTYIGADRVPNGHTEHATFRDAVSRALEDGFLPKS